MRILVHLHVFYHDQVPWFLDRLRYLDGYDWDLVVTWSKACAATEKAVRAFKPEARFLAVENVGYDVWPFLKMLTLVDVSPYDILFKLHTKNITSGTTVRLNGVHLRKAAWRNVLVDALLGSPEQVRSVVSVFREQADAGMVCSGKLYASLDFPEDGKMLTEELATLGLQTKERRFCVGNMFAVRPGLLAPLRKQDFRPGQFPALSHSGSGGTLAHVYERIFSLLAPAQGYRVVTMDPQDAAYERKMRLRKVLKPVLTFIFNLDREGFPRRKVLTVMGLKFKLHENHLPG
jgi:lipopolysaccharide biosynthesis protein